MNFIPAHRHLLVQKKQQIQEKNEPLVLLPEGYEPKVDNYTRVTVVKAANNCTIPATTGDELVVREGFIEELSLDGNIFYLVLENHVMGVIKNEKTTE